MIHSMRGWMNIVQFEIIADTPFAVINHRIERLINGKYRVRSVGVGFGMCRTFDIFEEAAAEADRRTGDFVN